MDAKSGGKFWEEMRYLHDLDVSLHKQSVSRNGENGNQMMPQWSQSSPTQDRKSCPSPDMCQQAQYHLAESHMEGRT
jgi:hypothetical protein